MAPTEFDIWLDDYLSRPILKGTTQVKTAPGPSIVELVEEEWHSCPDSQYSDGIAECLLILDGSRDEIDGRKPYYVMQDELKFAQNYNPEYERGVATALFIFTNTYRWLAGERI